MAASDVWREDAAPIPIEFQLKEVRYCTIYKPVKNHIKLQQVQNQLR
jgi:hypothetical protein